MPTPSLEIVQNPVTEGITFSVTVQLNISGGTEVDITLTLSTIDGSASMFMFYCNIFVLIMITFSLQVHSLVLTIWCIIWYFHTRLDQQEC